MGSGTVRRRLTLRGTEGKAWQTLRAWLPPVDRREFWAVQALVLAIAALHSWVENQHVLNEHSPIYLFPTTLYLIPIVYAAVNFGLRGSLLTALWSAVLVVPNLIFWHEGLERVGEVVQVVWITIAAVFVGSRVDRERAARLEAERREAERRESEERYRAIVNDVAEPIIVLDDRQRVVEANSAAAEVLGRSLSELRDDVLSGPDGTRIITELSAVRPGRQPASPIQLGDPPRWYELVTMDVHGPSATVGTQLLLRDVTASREREQGLEGITRLTLQTREEEQRRIARELHDGPLQTLVLLWRDLDELAAEAPEPTKAQLMEARGSAEGVADELRRFSRDLRPSVLDDLGIVAAIRSETETFGQRSRLEARMVVEGKARRLDQQVELALLRIVQEALRNVERHAMASEVEIRLEFGSDHVRVLISDDGVGLERVPSASELLSGSHMGIIGMQERARLVGARLSLRPAPRGLTVEVIAPVADAVPDEAGGGA